VTITGGTFDSSTAVTFGGEDATLVSRDSSSITVKTPAYSGVADADGKKSVAVEISNDDGDSAREANGFTYFLDGDGKAGAIGELSWYHLNGGYWSASAADYGGASVLFLTPPTDIHYWDLFAPSADECSGASYDPTAYFGDVYTLDMGASTVALSYGSQRITLNQDSTTGIYANRSDLTSAQVPTNQFYDLEEVDGTFAAEAFSIANFTKSSTSFSVSSPAINGSGNPLVSQSALNLSWSGGSGRKILIQAFLVEPASGDVLDEVYCVASDDGSFNVPSGAWSTTWPRNYFLYLYVGNVVETSATLPYNNSESRMIGVYWNVGVGLTN